MFDRKDVAIVAQCIKQIRPDDVNKCADMIVLASIKAGVPISYLAEAIDRHTVQDAIRYVYGRDCND